MADFFQTNDLKQEKKTKKEKRIQVKNWLYSNVTVIYYKMVVWDCNTTQLDRSSPG